MAEVGDDVGSGGAHVHGEQVEGEAVGLEGTEKGFFFIFISIL